MTGLHERQHGQVTDRDDLVGSNRLLETEAISDARSQQSLVWAAAAALGPRDASLLDLQLRHQLSPAEIADELDLTANNAHQLLFRLRNKLGDAIANHLLWRDGSPRCDELAALVDGDPFDAAVNKIVQRHSARCDECGPERERVVDPTKLFAAAPIVIAPVFLRDRVASALAAEGVPVTGTEATAPTEPAVSDDLDDNSDDGADAGNGSDHDGLGGAALAADTILEPAQRRPRGRAIGLLVVVITTVAAVIGLMTRPAGEVDLAIEAGPTSTDPVADVTPETDPPLALPSTTTTTPSTTTTTSSTSTTTSTSTTATPTTAPPVDPTPPPSPVDPTPPPPADPPPVIVRFSLRTPAGAIFCPDASDTARTANWFTEEATEVTLTTPNGTTPFDPSASHTFCAPTGSIITLTATGPGGTATDTETIT